MTRLEASFSPDSSIDNEMGEDRREAPGVRQASRHSNNPRDEIVNMKGDPLALMAL
jgi:hypothetical protein